MNVPERIDRVRAEALIIRMGLAVMAREFISLHSYSEDSDEGKLLATVITAGSDYETTLQTVMNSKREREPNDQRTSDPGSSPGPGHGRGSDT